MRLLPSRGQEVPMAHPLSGFATPLGLIAFALITAFSAPREPLVNVTVRPTVEIVDRVVELGVTPTLSVLDDPRVVVDHVEPLHGPTANPALTVRATAYNSLASQTDAQPFITATGARTEWGIIAVSRDLLREDLPYGSLVRLRDLGGFHSGRGADAYHALLDGTLFVVEDTMHARKVNQIDLWFADYASAVNWGVRRLEVEVVRYGRNGPTLDPVLARTDFELEPTWLAAR
jgi:3D (Asp-Asp-Asp) domain-containing protein